MTVVAARIISQLLKADFSAHKMVHHIKAIATITIENQVVYILLATSLMGELSDFAVGRSFCSLELEENNGKFLNCREND